MSERVGGAGDRGTQVGAGERGGGADVARPQLWNLLQPGHQVQDALAGPGLCGTLSSVLTGLKLVPEHQHTNLRLQRSRRRFGLCSLVQNTTAEVQ